MGINYKKETQQTDLWRYLIYTCAGEEIWALKNSKVEFFVKAHINHPRTLNMIWYPFSAKPECTVDPECPDHLACIEEKCKNPCFTSTCGVNAECRVTQHRALCICNPGYVGDPYRICEERKNAFVIFPSHSGIKMKKCVNLLVQEVAWLPQRLKSHIFWHFSSTLSLRK